MAEFWTLIVKSNTFNFIIMLIIFAIIWQKLNISEKLETIRLEIANFIENSKHEKENAEKQLETTKKDIENVKDEIIKTIESAKISAQNVYEEINKMTHNAVEKIEANVDKIIDNETRKINSKLTINTAQSAINLAKTKLKKMFEENPNLHEQYIEQSIEAIDRIKI